MSKTLVGEVARKNKKEFQGKEKQTAQVMPRSSMAPVLERWANLAASLGHFDKKDRLGSGVAMALRLRGACPVGATEEFAPLSLHGLMLHRSC